MACDIVMPCIKGGYMDGRGRVKVGCGKKHIWPRFTSIVSNHRPLYRSLQMSRAVTA